MDEAIKRLIEALSAEHKIERVAAEKVAEQLVSALASQVDCGKIDLNAERIKVWAQRASKGALFVEV
jgi:hypothetical protein